MDILLKNKGEIEAKVTEALNINLDECNIGGGYNTMRMM